MSGERTYAGQSATERRADRRARLLAAGIELLGTGGREGTTVRAVCATAGLTPRYFYESFDTLDDLLGAVFDEVVTSAARAVADALADAPAEPQARSRATIETFVGYAIDDPRRARILFAEGIASEALQERRAAALRIFAELAAEQGRQLYGVAPGSERLAETTAYLIAGGLAELLLAWVRGELASSREELIDDAAALLGAIGEAAATLAGGRAGR